MASEQELAKALGVEVADVRALRSNPQHASREMLAKLGRVLIERGKGMSRVGEMLLEDNTD
jgi:plasmid maintenance system antidote protein VapI